jgi:signal transduction histidine kinase
VRHLTEAMGGTIAATSTRGDGSTFRVQLPAADRPPPA